MRKPNSTFRSYLLSYMIILLIPTFVLTFFVFNYFLRYSTQELMARHEDSVIRIQRTVDMQVAQINAYASLISTTPVFSTSVLDRSYANFYDVTETLHNWELTSPFQIEIFVYNMENGRVYAANAVYTLSDFFRFGTRFASLSDDAFLQAIHAADTRRWLPVQENAEGAQVMTYMVPVGWKQRQVSSVAVFLFDAKTLDAVIDSAALNDHAATYLCDPQGDVLYSAHRGNAWSQAAVAQAFALDASAGYAQLDDTNALYVRQESENGLLRYLTIVPLDDANAPILSLQRLYYVALAAVLLCGCAIIVYGMVSHYRPIRKLARLTEDIAPSGSQGSEVDTAIRLLQSLSQSNRAMHSHTAALGKEKLILTLLIGGFPSVEAFRQEAQALSLAMPGDVWRIMLVRIEVRQEGSEDYAARLTQSQRAVFAPEYTSLYVEFPESNQIVFILSGNVADDALLAAKTAALTQEMQADGVMLSTTLSSLCRDISQLHAAYMAAKKTDAADAAEYQGGWIAAFPADLIASLSYAISMQEKERVLFALDSLISTMRSERSSALTGYIAFGTVQTAMTALQAAGRQTENVATLWAAFSAKHPVAGPEEASALLRKLAQCILSEIETESTQASEQIAAIQAYIRAHVLDPSFYAKRVADHFGMSVSNLSHYFKSRVGITLSESIESLRMERATELLRTTSLPIAEVAARVGYLQPTSFMRKFKQCYGVTPSMYRRESRADG